MDRNQAKEKIEKLLRLANNKGATSSERDTALEMATKLASKHGFRIQKAAPSNSTSDKFEEILNNIRYNSQKVQKNRYEFDLNCFNKKFVSFLFNILGIKDYFFTGRKTVIVYDYRKFDVDNFKSYYKHFVSSYYALKGNFGLKEKEFFENFSKEFTNGYYSSYPENLIYRCSYNLGHNLKNTRIIY